MPKRSAKTVNAIDVTNLSVRLANATVLDGVTFAIPKSAITAIIGPNGSGKTTLMKAMLGLIPYEGNVEILGTTFEATRHRIGYVQQRFDFDREFPISVREFLGLARRSPVDLAHILREVGLPITTLNKKLGGLSGGQLQRVLIAQAIMNEPDILFLDEPSTGVDVQGEAALYEVLAHLKDSHGTTIVMVSHDLNMIADIVDHIVCINRRIICTGTPQKTLTPKRLSELYSGHAQHFGHGHAHG